MSSEKSYCIQIYEGKEAMRVISVILTPVTNGKTRRTYVVSKLVLEITADFGNG
jgi:hypothetical protein